MSNDVLDLSLNLPFLDQLYERYRVDPASVDPSWRHLFENGALSGEAASPPPLAPSLFPTSQPSAGTTKPTENGSNGHGATATATTPHPGIAPYEARFARMYALVNAYRVRGHLEAKLDPLDHLVREPH